jgi:hypothetical protein
MQIQYRATGHRREVSDSVGARLCKARIAVEVDAAPPQTYLTRDLRAEDGQEISPLTGRPKRAYRRRDQSAEE